MKKIESALKKEYNAGAKKAKSTASNKPSSEPVNVDVNVSVLVGATHSAKKRKVDVNVALQNKKKRSSEKNEKQTSALVDSDHVSSSPRPASSSFDQNQMLSLAHKKQTARCSRGNSHQICRPPEAKSEPEDRPKKSSESNAFSGSEPLHVSGTWAISCPEIESIFGAQCTIRMLAVFHENSYFVWGDYDFGAFHSVFKAWPVRKGLKGSQDFQLEWRGRETGEGEMSLGPTNVGGFSVYRDESLGGSFRKMWARNSNLQGTGCQARLMRAAEKRRISNMNGITITLGITHMNG